MLTGASAVRQWSQNKHFASLQLEWLGVHRDFQRQGFGTILMGRVIDCFVASIETTGIPALTCVALNADVASFYKMLGFIQYGAAGSQPNMLLPAQSALELKKMLDKSEDDVASKA